MPELDRNSHGQIISICSLYGRRYRVCLIQLSFQAVSKSDSCKTQSKRTGGWNEQNGNSIVDFIDRWLSEGRRRRSGKHVLEPGPRAPGLVKSAELRPECAPRGENEGSDTVLARRAIVSGKAWRYANAGDLDGVVYWSNAILQI